MKSKNDDVIGIENHFEDENKIVAERKEKLKKIKEKYGDPYPNKRKPSARAKNIIDEYNSTERADLENKRVYCFASWKSNFKKAPGQNNVLCVKGLYRENSALFK